MNLPETSTPLFSRLRFVLVETSRPGNIGAAARAMKTMGFSELVLVKPRVSGVLLHEEAVAFASGAQDILAGAQIVGSVAEALEGCNFAAAMSARLREFSPPVFAPAELARHAVRSELNVALVFGNERFGLSNDDVERCNALINIPANPDYSSLNLAQAVQILAYECRMASLSGEPATSSNIGFQGEAANLSEIDGMYAHLEEALIAIEFLDPTNPKRLMSRLRRLFTRTQLETEEVNILRGIANQILRKMR